MSIVFSSLPCIERSASFIVVVHVVGRTVLQSNDSDCKGTHTVYLGLAYHLLKCIHSEMLYK